MSRLVNTQTAAKELFGVDGKGRPNIRVFLTWARKNDLKPVHGVKHHLWWDLNKLIQHLDNASDIQPESKVDYDEIIRRRLHGGTQGAILTH